MKTVPPERNGDYEVGYKKPPKETRFKKGNKANPYGRPRGSKNLATLLEAALDTAVTVVEGGAQRQRTQRDVVIAKLVERSASADLRATKLLLDMLQKLQRSGAPAPAEPAGPDADAYEQLRAKLARLALAQEAKAPAAEPPEAADPVEADPREDKNSYS